jgi:sugar porter (SP) family MFS transporter
MIGSPATSYILDRVGRKMTMHIVVVVALVASVLLTIGWSAAENLPVLIVGRIVVGIAGGIASVASPMYVGEMAPERHSTAIGVMFQIGCTFGIVVAAFVGLMLDPRTDTVDDAHVQARFQVMNALSFLIALALVPVAVAMPESTTWLRRAGADDDDDASIHPGECSRVISTTSLQLPGAVAAAAATAAADGPWYDGMLLPIAVAAVLAAAQQMTGINAIMTFAPEITGRVGFHPLLGNFVIMVWNFVTSFGSIPLNRRLPARVAFIWCTGIASAACFLTGIPTFPGVVDESAKQVLAGLGILLFVAFFEFAIGPSFYILAQDIFPEAKRSVGCGIANAWLWFFNLIINFGFPVAMTGMSGGPSGDQDQGMALCFMLFGVFGAFCTVFLALKMPRTESELRADAVIRDVDALQYSSL